jgi:predicted DsbA family dithiol-disulfide isomerase
VKGVGYSRRTVMIKVEIYSDIVCPWCYIGEHRFFQALSEFPQADQVEVVFRPFQLDPGAPPRGIPLAEYLERRYGSKSIAMMDRVGLVAAEEGISIDWDRALAGNTHTAHRLLRLAEEEYGAGVQLTLAQRLFALHFTHGGDVTDPEQLAAEASSVGMDSERTRAYLDSNEGVWELDEEFDRARAFGVTAVPTFVFDGRWAVQGAQRTSAFLQALERAVQEAAARDVESAGEACDDGVCAV